MKNGIGIGFLDNGDIYSGIWKDGKREGNGVCKMFDTKGAYRYYKGEWHQDQIHGTGIMVMNNGLTL